MIGLVTLALAAEPAGFDAHGFVLHAADGDVRDPLTLDRPGPWEQGDFWFFGLFEYADRPLVAVYHPEFGDDPTKTEVVLDQLLALNVNAGAAVHDYLRLDATAPVYFYSLGPDGEPQSPVLGDVRAGATVPIFRPTHVVGGGGPGLGVSAHADIPTGNPAMFLGQPGVGGGFAVSGTWEGPFYTFTAELGGQFNPAISLGNLVNSDELVAGLAANVLASPTTGFTAEAHLYAPFTANEVAGTAMPAEALLSMRHRFDNGASVVLGGSAGLSEGASAARYRAFFGFGYGMLAPPRAKDLDAPVALSVQDACPDAPETINGWRDDDGCPDELGRFGVRVQYQGRDVDDAELAVRGPDGEQRYRSSERPSFKAVPGTRFDASAEDPARCLVGAASGEAGEKASELVVTLTPRLALEAAVEVVDPTGAPVPNPVIRWSSGAPTCITPGLMQAASGNALTLPIGPGTHHLTVEAPGYKVSEQDVDVRNANVHVLVRLEPSRVVLERTRIVILDKVFFEFNKAVIKPESFGLLDDVAGVILAHPDIGKVQVEGHTDDKGNDAYNLKLSQSRAESVRTYLIGRGVSPDQLVAIGFGETRPVDTNQTEDGRGNNRRVEFNLVDQPPEGVVVQPPGGTP